MLKMKYVIIIYVCIAWRSGIRSAKVAELSVGGDDQGDTVPGVARADPRNVRIRCAAELDSEERLYSLKLYSAANEIFRYTPKNKPTTRSFEAGGAHVVENVCLGLSCDVSFNISVRPVSDASPSFLRLRCEATTAGPHFLTAHREIKVTLEAEGEGSPVLSWSREESMARCETAPALPPASLVWTVDDAPPAPASWEPLSGHGAAESWGGRTSWATLRARGAGVGYAGLAGRRLRCLAGSRSVDLLVPGDRDALYDHYTAPAASAGVARSRACSLMMMSTFLWKIIHKMDDFNKNLYLL